MSELHERPGQGDHPAAARQQPGLEGETSTGRDDGVRNGKDLAAAAGAGESPPVGLRDLFGYLREHQFVLGIVVAVSVIGAALSLAQPVVVNQVIDAVGSGTPISSLVLLLVGLVILSGVFGAAQQYLLERTAEAVVLGARRNLIDSVLRLPIREYDTRRIGDLVSRVGSDTTLIRAALTGGLIDALGGALIFVGAVVAMAVIDLTLLSVTAGVLLVAVVAVVMASARIQTLTRASQEAVGRVAAGVDRALSAIRTVRAAGATDREARRLTHDAAEAYRLGVQIAKIGAVLWPVSGLAIQGAFLAVLGLGGYRVAAGTLSVADLVAFILFLFMMLMPLGQGFSAVITVRTALGALGRIEEITALPSEETVAGKTASDHAAPLGVTRANASPGAWPGTSARLDTAARLGASTGALVFDRVCFAYRDDTPVLQDVTFAAAAGRTTAIVGPSGAGKTTVLALIERFYEPRSGTIRVHGVDIRALPHAALRAQIGYVEQDAPVLAGTIRDNLLLACPGASEERCRRVLASVNLLDRVDEHADGVDATVGDDGVGLSGGERQRLAIARALMADNPVLLLDEPTASLDGRNEQAMRQAIGSAAAGRTVLIVAHRLATVAGAARIVLMDAGRVVATGTHPQLLNTSVLYRELARHQLLA